MTTNFEKTAKPVLTEQEMAAAKNRLRISIQNAYSEGDPTDRKLIKIPKFELDSKGNFKLNKQGGKIKTNIYKDYLQFEGELSLMVYSDGPDTLIIKKDVPSPANNSTSKKK